MHRTMTIFFVVVMLLVSLLALPIHAGDKTPKLPKGIVLEDRPKDARQAKIVFIAGSNFYQPGEHVLPAPDGVGEVPRERPSRALDQVFHHPGEEVRSRLLDLFFDRSRDVRVLAVFDDRDTVAGPDVEARSDRVLGARLILGTHVAHSVAPGLPRAPTKDGP